MEEMTTGYKLFVIGMVSLVILSGFLFVKFLEWKDSRGNSSAAE